MAARLWLRQVVSRGPLHGDAGGVRHLPGPDHRAAGRSDREDQGAPPGMAAMSVRLASGGLLIDRDRPLSFTFDGERLAGYEGDTLASALLANDRVLVGRSFKYHRPRGILASGSEEPNALMGVGGGTRFEPNQRATTTSLHEGLVAISQNRWPSLENDIGVVGNWVSKLAPV